MLFHCIACPSDWASYGARLAPLCSGYVATQQNARSRSSAIRYATVEKSMLDASDAMRALPNAPL